MSFKAAQDSFQLPCTVHLRCSTAFSSFIAIKYKPNTKRYFLPLVTASAYLTGFFLIPFLLFFSYFFYWYPTALEEMQYMSTSPLIDWVKVILAYIYVYISAFLSFKFVWWLTFVWVKLLCCPIFRGYETLINHCNILPSLWNNTLI